MKWDVSLRNKVQKFPGKSGWVFVSVPKKHTKALKEQRQAWGMYPITAHVGDTSWNTKLMMKKGGDFFVALKTEIRKKENVVVGDMVKLDFKVNL